MKKLFVLTAFAVFGLSNVNAQSNFKAGVNVGLPLGDIKDLYTLNIGVEVNYLWEVSDQFDAGIIAGYSHYLGDSIGSFDFEDAGFIPIAAAGRFNVSDDFTIGADLGYAIGVSPSGNDGGFYYAPKVQYGVSESLDIVLAYKGVSVDGGTFSSINLGIEFGL
tara:strand:- start:258 stop:746 length:489 start_codon:yes stop_codon:yes gene_type:complete